MFVQSPSHRKLLLLGDVMLSLRGPLPSHVPDCLTTGAGALIAGAVVSAGVIVASPASREKAAAAKGAAEVTKKVIDPAAKLRATLVWETLPRNAAGCLCALRAPHPHTA